MIYESHTDYILTKKQLDLGTLPKKMEIFMIMICFTKFITDQPDTALRRNRIIMQGVQPSLHMVSLTGCHFRQGHLQSIIGKTSLWVRKYKTHKKSREKQKCTTKLMQCLYQTWKTFSVKIRQAWWRQKLHLFNFPFLSAMQWRLN